MSRDVLEQFTQAYRQQTDEDSARATEQERASTRRRLLESLGAAGSQGVAAGPRPSLEAEPASELVATSKVVSLHAYANAPQEVAPQEVTSESAPSASAPSAAKAAPELLGRAASSAPTLGISEPSGPVLPSAAVLPGAAGDVSHQGRFEQERVDLEPSVRRRGARGRVGRRALAWTIPLAAILIGGAAFAAADGRLAELQEWVAEVFSPEPPSAAGVAKHRAKNAALGGAAAPELMPTASVEPTAGLPLPEALPLPEELEPAVVAEVVAPKSSPPARALPRPKRPVTRAKAQPTKAPVEVTEASPSETATPTETTPSTLKEDATLPAYRRAHRLHFQVRDYAQALSAWTEYLRAAPRGRFATEARYNRALCYVRLGQQAAARRELRPFAEGRYAGYRQQEAIKLVKVLK